MMPMWRPTLSRYVDARRDARRLIGRRAVREVDPEHVGAREDQLLDDGRVVGRGPSVATILVRRRTSSPRAFGTKDAVSLRLWLAQYQSEVVDVGSRRAGLHKISAASK